MKHFRRAVNAGGAGPTARPVAPMANRPLPQADVYDFKELFVPDDADSEKAVEPIVYACQTGKAGGFGVYYVALDTGEAVVAGVKVFESGDGASARREFGCLKELNGCNGHTPLPLAMGRFGNKPAIVMQHFDLKSLATVLENGDLSGTAGTPLDCGWTLELARELALAFGEVHRRGWSHRDAWPENILLRYDNSPLECKLIDLGQAAKAGTRSLPPATARFRLGQAYYAAPEMLSALIPACDDGGDWEYRNNPSCDMYTFGSLIYRARTGLVPHCAEIGDVLSRLRAQGRKGYSPDVLDGMASVKREPLDLLPRLGEMQEPGDDVLACVVERCTNADPSVRGDMRWALGMVMEAIEARGSQKGAGLCRVTYTDGQGGRFFPTETFLVRRGSSRPNSGNAYAFERWGLIDGWDPPREPEATEDQTYTARWLDAAIDKERAPVPKRRGTPPTLAALRPGDGDLDKANREVGAFYQGMLRPALDRYNLTKGVVISIYGFGGQGKSYFLNEVANSVQENDPGTVCVRANFYHEEAARPNQTDVFAAALKKQGLFCPCYTLAKAAMDDLYSAVANLMSELDGFQLGFDDSQKRREAVRIAIEAARQFEGLGDSAPGMIPKLSKDSIEERVGRFLRWDIEQWSALEDKPIVILVDQAEYLLDRRIGDLSVWFKEVTCARNTVWVVVGRNRVNWENVIQYPLRFVELDQDDSFAMAKSIANGELDDAALAAICDFSRGVPIYIDLATSYAKELDSLPDDMRELFDGIDHDTIAPRYLRLLDENEQDACMAAAFLGEWTDSDLDLFLPDWIQGRDRPRVVRKVGEMSFVLSSLGYHFMHECVARTLRESVGPKSDFVDTLDFVIARLISDGKNHIIKMDLSVQERNQKLRWLGRAERAIYPRCSKRARDELREAMFGAIMEYAGNLRGSRMSDEAKDLYDYALDEFGDDPEKELKLRLNRSAALSEMYISTGDVALHMEALEDEQKVLERAQALLKEDSRTEWAQNIAANAESSVGVSKHRLASEAARAGELRKAERLYADSFALLESAKHEVLKKSDGRNSAAYARLLNNYGAVCLSYAKNLPDAVDAAQRLDDALASCGESHRIRRSLFGDQDRSTLLSLTNVAVAYEDMGSYEEALEILRAVERDLAFAGKTQWAKDLSRCRYHIAIILEKRAGEKPDENRKKALEEALTMHMKVLDYRKANLGEKDLDTKKSLQAVSRLKALIRSI
ncbi:Serine/threonine-protein kinase pknK [Slackia heliotrinireducens]|uniref:Serine/threonine protein kinase n=1 Tax=Slackia heliotrinireducens (strain ATCC 29202 / DSM 20476 / NCTC 11029 / RHS 1) TaxID=471855 RepID=C7N288_SLAHD|nr:tetratricopeptide repeat-containing protein kinase family protein [Slackia heliotrinireducens]ACV21394.1 serine/threonine protein kinase [Slackia heliotrinireducens DSM 20476]VEG98827.1 Serine/threonine-protein kinase pknK [Slackia heliotrinireducens]